MGRPDPQEKQAICRVSRLLTSVKAMDYVVLDSSGESRLIDQIYSLFDADDRQRRVSLFRFVVLMESSIMLRATVVV